MPIGKLYLYNTDPAPPPTAPGTSPSLWSSYAFHTSELEDNSITPSTIITLFAHNDSSRFTSPINNNFLCFHHFRLQIDEGANRSVTNNRDCLHTYWSIVPYRISGIGDVIIYTEKAFSTCFATTVPSYSSQCSFLLMPLKLSSHLRIQCSPIQILLIVGGRWPTAKLVWAICASTNQMKLLLLLFHWLCLIICGTCSQILPPPCIWQILDLPAMNVSVLSQGQPSTTYSTIDYATLVNL